jgi:hypothetical protein
MKMNLEEFINSAWQNFWIHEPGLQIYIRKTPKKYKHKWGDLQLASISAEKPGNGALTRFLDKYEPKYQFYLENVFEERLVKFFQNRGYVILNKIWYPFPQYPACMMGLDPNTGEENGHVQ